MLKFLSVGLTLLLITLSGVGCALNAEFPLGREPDLVLTIDQVSAANRPGNYTVRGQTSLPEGTPLTISAIRYLSPASPSNDNQANNRFSILTRKTALVKGGRWAADLALWQVSPDGRYRENWQTLPLAEEDTLSPSPTVTFWATLEPLNLTDEIQNRLGPDGQQPASQLLAVTPEGEPYLRTQSALAIPLPEGRTTVPAPAEDLTAAWAARRESDPSAQIKSPETIPFQETDNLPLPEANMMR